MARGDVTLFNEFMLDALGGVHAFPGDTLKIGIVDDTITPAADDPTPRWADYSANEVATTGNYTADGETLTSVAYTLVSDLATLAADDVNIGIDASGFLYGYWGILYNDGASNKEAIGFVDMGGPVSEQAGDVDFEWTGGVVAEFPANVA